MSSLFAAAEIPAAIAIGTGVGTAVGDVVTPKLQSFLNDRWAEHADKPLSASQVAELLAEEIQNTYASYGEAAFTGYTSGRVDALRELALTAPGAPELLVMLRRGTINAGNFTHGLRKAKLEPMWDAALADLQHVKLTPQELAVMIQRGIVANDGILPVGPPAGAGRVPPMPQEPIDPIVEAAMSGYDQPRLAALAKIIGLPASPDLAARMVFRNIIDRIDFDRAISEGNTRNEWAPFLFEGFREILTSHNYVEARIRNWIDDAQMQAGTALHGMSVADTDLLFKVLGRPLSFHQVFIGERRGGVYNGDTAGIDPAFLKSLEESDIRPEWYNLAWAQRYNYPTAFVLRALTEAGDITETQAHDILLFEGWEPTLAQTVAAKWAGSAGGAGPVNPWVKKAEGQLWTAVHKAYVGGTIDQLGASPSLTAIGVDGASQAEIFKLWDLQKAV